jgi:hypothetical protein
VTGTGGFGSRIGAGSGFFSATGTEGVAGGCKGGWGPTRGGTAGVCWRGGTAGAEGIGTTGKERGTGTC